MATPAIQPLPDHTPFASEVPAHLVRRISNDGTLTVEDAATGDLRQMRLAVVSVGGVLALAVVGDP